jgi:hypothetical protein
LPLAPGKHATQSLATLREPEEVMRTQRLSPHLPLAILFGLWIGFAVPLSAALNEALRTGYVKGDHALVAIEANTVVVICEDTGLLVIRPDAKREASKALGATILDDGRWQLASGAILSPKEASFQFGDETNGTLPIAAKEDIELANTADTGQCKQVIRGYRCYTTSQGGCNNACVGTRLWQSGPAVFSYCEPGAPTDTCVQTAGSVTCTFADFQGPGCAPYPPISTGTQTFPNC